LIAIFIDYVFIISFTLPRCFMLTFRHFHCQRWLLLSAFQLPLSADTLFAIILHADDAAMPAAMPLSMPFARRQRHSCRRY